MAKKKAAKRLPNPHLHARVSYLYQAANYFQSQHGLPSNTRPHVASGRDEPKLPRQMHAKDSENETSTVKSGDKPEAESLDKGFDISGPSRRLITHMRAVTLKSQVRLSRDIKRSLCKRCDTLLVSGSTSQCFIENRSKGGKKPWADVYVIECLKCGAQKRFPTGSKRQIRTRTNMQVNEEHEARTPAPGTVKYPS